MTQSVVTIRLNGTPYQIGCGVGEEDQVMRLGAEVEDVQLRCHHGQRVDEDLRQEHEEVEEEACHH